MTKIIPTLPVKIETKESGKSSRKKTKRLASKARDHMAVAACSKRGHQSTRVLQTVQLIHTVSEQNKYARIDPELKPQIVHFL